MTKKLSTAQVERYARDGFLSPVPALTRAEAAAYLGKLEAFETTLGGRLTSAETDARYRSRTHVLLTWVHDLVRHSAILDAVEDLIGPDILVYTSTWFIKEPESAAIAGWHQDATYFGLSPYVHVTAWLALTDATAANGCMEFLPGSHDRQRPHQAGVVADSVNRAGQAVVEAVDDRTAVHAPLAPGEFSLHHTLVMHRSQPNRSHGRRIGLAVSYVPTHVQHLGVRHKTPAMLVRGVDRFGHFELEPAPVADLDEAARAAYARSYDGYRASYAEQVATQK